jgi:hypothetical protein
VQARAYPYVGPRELRELASAEITRIEPESEAHLASWIRASYGLEPTTFTYVVTELGRFRISDRHTEHVSCAEGLSVLAAGEVELIVKGDEVHVETLTNQSTGYCPEPSCFPAIARALAEAGLDPPSSFTHEFVFRRCRSCHDITVVKGAIFECPSCESDLPAEWNCDE